MTVKRYGSVLFDTGLIEMACGDYVTYSDYQKLVAENAALKDSANFYRMGFKPTKGAFGIEYKPTEALLDDCGNNAINALKTPATDAAIAEIKAQGVDELISLLDRMPLNDMSQFDVTSSVVEFAANLRAGRNG